MVFKQDVLRRGILPISATVFFIILLGHKSTSPLFFARYSGRHLFLMCGMGIWAVICWRIALDTARYTRFTKRLFTPTFFSLAMLSLYAGIVLDIIYKFEHTNPFYSLFPLVNLLPVILIIMTWFLSTEDILNGVNNLALLLSVCIIGLALSEWGFRTFLLKPLVPKTDRDFDTAIVSAWPRQILEENTTGAFRILGLSDSFGRAGDSGNYHYLLEKRLREMQHNVEVINLSQGGYAPIDELAILKHFGERYRPDIVLHGLFIGNDLIENDLARSQSFVIGNTGIPMNPHQGLDAYWPHNFLMFEWLERSLILLHDSKLRQQEKYHQERTGSFSQELFLTLEWKRLAMCFRKVPKPEVKWKETFRILDEIRQEALRIGATYIIVMHPAQIQVEQELRHQLENAFQVNPEEYDFELPQKFVRDYCNSRGISCLDLLPDFREHGRTERLYLFRDSHYNETGNILAAEEIFTFFTEQDLF